MGVAFQRPALQFVAQGALILISRKIPGAVSDKLQPLPHLGVYHVHPPGVETSWLYLRLTEPHHECVHMGAVVVQPLPYCARHLGLVQLRGDGRTQGALARLNQALPFVCTRSPQTILRDTSGGGWHPRAELL